MSSTPPGARVPTAHGRRAEILRAAAVVFAREGYSGANLKDVADTAGILTGSLYHHVSSKEALAVELVSAFHAEVEVLAARRHAAGDPLADLLRFAEEVAELGERHRAAVYMTVFDAPSRAADLSPLVGRQPATLDRAWATRVEAARAAGRLRPEVDPAELREVLGAAIFALAANPRVDRLPELGVSVAGLLLHGLLADTPAVAPLDADLDAAPPARAAREAIARWPADAAGTGRRATILAAARREFARRGYRATTVRDIARSAGTQPTVLYRHFGSKEQLLAEIIETYSRRLLDGWTTVFACPGTPAQRLDGLAGLMAAAAARFRPEFEIVKDWWRTLGPLGPVGAQAPPPDNAARLQLLELLLAEGRASGSFATGSDPALLPVAVRAVLWSPLTRPGPDAARRRHRLLRSCLLSGAAAVAPTHASPGAP